MRVIDTLAHNDVIQSVDPQNRGRGQVGWVQRLTGYLINWDTAPRFGDESSDGSAGVDSPTGGAKGDAGP